MRTLILTSELDDLKHTRIVDDASDGVIDESDDQLIIAEYQVDRVRQSMIEKIRISKSIIEKIFVNKSAIKKIAIRNSIAERILIVKSVISKSEVFT